MDRYTKFILTMIAVGILGLNYHLFKDEIISPAHAVESHTHSSYEIYGIEDHSHPVQEYRHGHSASAIQGLENHDHDANDIWGFDSKVRSAVNSACSVSYGIIMC